MLLINIIILIKVGDIVIRKTFDINKKNLRHNSYYNKLISRVILVLVTLLVILIIKTINTKTTNNIIQIIEKNIYYDFNWKEDGEKARKYLKGIFVDTMESIETFSVQKLNFTK